MEGESPTLNGNQLIGLQFKSINWFKHDINILMSYATPPLCYAY